MQVTKVTLDDWQTAISLVAAYEIDGSSDLWVKIYEGISEDQFDFSVFALTGLCANLLSNLADRLDKNGLEILNELSTNMEEFFTEN